MVQPIDLSHILDESIKVSVSIITYNQKDFIAQAIESVLQQRVNFKIEIIIGDDFSTDGTRDILINYQKQYPDVIKLILHPKRNEGLPGKLNFLSTMYAAKGKYIALLDGDDYWTDLDKLQIQADFLDANADYVICFHDAYEVDTTGKEIKVFDLNAGLKEITTLEDLSRGNYIYAVSSFFRNNVVKSLPAWFYIVNAGDYPIHLFLSEYGKLKFINKKMGAYRIHGQGFFTANKPEKLSLGNVILLGYLTEYFKKNRKVRYNLKHQISGQIRNLLNLYYERQDVRAYSKFYLSYIFNSNIFQRGNGVLYYSKLFTFLFVKKILNSPA